MELTKVNQDIDDMRGLLSSCEDAQELSELRKLMTALREDRKALLEKEARLAGMAAGELVGLQQGCKIWPEADAGKPTSCMTT